MKKFKCKICGYVYYPENGDSSQNIKKNTDFKDLPDKWVCPICGATKDKFLTEH